MAPVVDCLRWVRSRCMGSCPQMKSLRPKNELAVDMWLTVMSAGVTSRSVQPIMMSACRLAPKVDLYDDDEVPEYSVGTI